jgi:hypothetical protein
MARKVHASYTKFQALVGPWDHVAEGAYHQLVGGDIEASDVWPQHGLRTEEEHRWNDADSS